MAEDVETVAMSLKKLTPYMVVHLIHIQGTTLPHTLSPPMGTGGFPTKDLTRSSFMKQLRYFLSDYTLEDINSNEMEYYVDDPKCYGVMFLKYVDFNSREALTFGGPGGRCRSDG
ncbi:unnamed protein product [Microthlaspi erraticum]|uniref:Neprosin PEP catalytic domain-containing protein n=1 Tax=Microthlaspi erraticum TaxID=1685480 RepID=A0A6D2I0J9_9BRAS|nr:unnamed protein product [Microthlaspi erraticum]